MSEKQFIVSPNNVVWDNQLNEVVCRCILEGSGDAENVCQRLNEQQDTITGFQEKIFELRDDKEQLHTEISKLRQEVAELKTRNAVLSSHLHRIPPKIREVWLE